MSSSSVASALNDSWLILTGALVFFMKAGFALLEAGNVKKSFIEEVLVKNLIDTCITALAWYAFGFSWFGGLSGSFIGNGSYFQNGVIGDFNSFWFFEFAFCAAAAAIVSGAMCARTRLESYFVFTFIMSALIYPTVAHWVWNPFGWLCAARRPDSLFLGEGMLDFAGSGVVHTCGGFAGLVGAYLVGPRKGRFSVINGKTVATPNFITKSRLQVVCNALSVFILWFGWYGFNPGSSIVLVGASGHQVSARAAINTTLAPATAGIVGLFLGKMINNNKAYNFDGSMNCMLAGLAAITGGCAYVPTGFAILIGAVSAFVYYGASYLLLHVLHIDDPLDAFPVHGACGVWGVLATGFLVDKQFKLDATGATVTNLGMQFAAQLVGILAIIGWTAGCTAIIFGTMKLMSSQWPTILNHEESEPEMKTTNPEQEMKAV